jgi:hypothetical protein
MADSLKNAIMSGDDKSGPVGSIGHGQTHGFAHSLNVAHEAQECGYYNHHC